MPVPTFASLTRPQRDTRLRDTAAPVPSPAPAAACHAGRQAPSPHLWGIILAGGDGRRLWPLTQVYCGSARPKQYCTFFGDRSLLRRTLGRAEHLIPAARLLTIVTKGHLAYAREELSDRAPETVIIQPCNRETGAGILLPLLHIVQRDPRAIVALFPSDHFILEEQQFMATVATAVAALATQPRHLVVLGVVPDGPEVEYGWLETGTLLGQVGGTVMYQVRHFWEKPTLEVAESLYRQQALWNTLVLVGHAGVLLALFATLTPALYAPLARCREVLGSPHELQVLQEVYATLPVVNFSRAILAQSAPCLGVLPVQGMHWSDWGSPSRVLQDIVRYQLGDPIRIDGLHSRSGRWS
jgi:mannose-1-phosphate guanylyltransferase